MFISYSWTSPSHEEWVLKLAIDLRANGVDAILDKWDLKEGQDKYAFMEEMVNNPEIKKVVMVCNRSYAEKADVRSGGVGTETQIITPEIYEQQEQTKFVAVLSERDNKGEPCLPRYCKTRVYIDLSTKDLYITKFDQLLRWIFDKPRHEKPELGKTPAFLNDDESISLPTTAQYRHALKAIRENSPNCQDTVTSYFQVFTSNLDRFRITRDEEEFDEKVVGNIDEFLPYRNEAIEIFIALATYRATQESWDALHGFFERLIPYLDRPEGVTTWHESDFDNFKFIIHELFLYAVAALIRSERFGGVSHILRQHYYVAQNPGRSRDAMVPFLEIRQHVASLEHRNKRLELRRRSLHADLLERRANLPEPSFREIMQADFVLFIWDCLDCLRSGRWQRWWPVTWVYVSEQHGPFEVFARSQSANYFKNLQQVLEIESKEDLTALAQAFEEGKLEVPSAPFSFFNPLAFIGLEKLGTLP